MKFRYKILLAVSLTFTLASCDGLLEFEPEGVLQEDEALQTPEDLQNLLNSCYDVLANTYDGRSQNLHECLSDNLDQPNNQDDYVQVYNRGSNFFNGSIEDYFKQPYIAIDRSNVLLKYVNTIDGVSDSENRRTQGEARFIRAFAHFDLVRLFAQPAGYTPDNSHLGISIREESSGDPTPRSTVAETYNFIISDLQYAVDNLPEENGVYANKWAAKALLGKVYYQMQNYSEALTYLNDVANNSPYSLTDLNRFSPDMNSENIFTIISLSVDYRCEGFTDNYRGANPKLVVPVEFINEYFPGGLAGATDLRSEWFSIINEGQNNQMYTVAKYDLDFFNVPVIHLTDVKLMRAECLANLNQDLSTALTDINEIRARAGLDPIPGGQDAQSLLNEIHTQRRIEMIGEGDRVQQLKRRGAQGENIEVRDAPWDCPGMILQFPISEKTDDFVMNEEGGC